MRSGRCVELLRLTERLTQHITVSYQYLEVARVDLFWAHTRESGAGRACHSTEGPPPRTAEGSSDRLGSPNLARGRCQPLDA